MFDQNYDTEAGGQLLARFFIGVPLNAKQSLLKQIQSGALALKTDEEIAKALRLGKAEARVLREMLLSLVREGQLLVDQRSRFGTAETFCAKRGTITGNERGFGFFTPDDGSGDLFIPRGSLRGALHGDIVLAFRVGGKYGDEGEVLHIFERGFKEIVGVYRHERKAGYLHPDERKYAADVFIPSGKHLRCPSGAKAVARIDAYPAQGPVGEIIEILGKDGDFLTEERAIIRAHSLREQFPSDVLAAADRAAALPIDCRGRLDLREKLIITVDGEDTRDIDDAISIERHGKNFALGVHIADVSHYVKRNRTIDREAFLRGTSVYFPDRVLPMLPAALSNGICSLNEGADRLTLSCLMTIDAEGRVLKKQIAPSVIRSRHRMTYDAVAAIYEKQPEALEAYPDLIRFTEDAVALTNILKAARARRGAVDLDLKEAKILFRDGKISIPESRRTIAHDMIEQFMVIANESVAAIMTEHKMPFVYRVHERPSEEKARGFSAFLKEAGIPARFDPAHVMPQDYGALIGQIADSPLYSVVNRVMLRSMMKARYAAENLGHFGLASECYCHFTSPIRRYPDLCIHRIIKDFLLDPETARTAHASFVSEAAARSSLTERNAAEAERDVDALYITAYMQDRIGEEYEAVISGVTAFGLYAELPNTVEGFLPIETLPDDSYTFFEDNFVLKGTRHGFRLGERIQIRVVGVDWGARKVQFGLIAKVTS